MVRLLVNPGTPQAWEIQLKPGSNRIGSGDNNDFSIDHPTISGHHCELFVGETSVLLRDLASTSGTFINREPVKEAFLHTGQHIQLGAVELIFESTVADDIAAALAVPTPVGVTPGEPESTPKPAGSGTALPALLSVGAAVCKNHPDTPAQFHCNKCHEHFCDRCVADHAAGACGLGLVTGEPQAGHKPTAPKDLLPQLPGTLLYPFQGSGLLMIMAGTLVFAGLALLNGPIYPIVFQIAALGYLFSFQQNVVRASADGKPETPELPGLAGLVGALLHLAVTATVSFVPAIALAVARIQFGVEIPAGVTLAAVVLGCGHFPMAFLAVTMKNSVLAANPATVISAILKTPLACLITALLLLGVLTLGHFGSEITVETKSAEPTANNLSLLLITFGLRAAYSFIAVYLLTVHMRVLGLLHLCEREKFGWANR